MVRIVTAGYYDALASELRQMHAQRKTEYHDQLRWDVGIESGLEFDDYDRCDPIYLLAMGSRCLKVWGSLRLHPIIGPGPLQQHFPELVWRANHTYIWETSRLCYGYKADAYRTTRLQREVATELIQAQSQIGWLVGADVVVCVIDLRMERQLDAIGIGGERVGGPKRLGSNYAVVMAWATAAPPTGRARRINWRNEREERGQQGIKTQVLRRDVTF